MKLSICFSGAFAVASTFVVAVVASAEDPLHLVDNMVVRAVPTVHCPATVTETVTQTICVSSSVAPPALPSSTTGAYNPPPPVVTSSGGSAPPEASSFVPPRAPSSPVITESTAATGSSSVSTAPSTPSGSGSVTTGSVSPTPSHSHETSTPASTSSAPPTQTTNGAALVGMKYGTGALTLSGLLLNALMVVVV